MAREIKLGKIYIGQRPIEALSVEEREAFSRRCLERMGQAITDYYSNHPEELWQLQGLGGPLNQNRSEDTHGRV